MDDWELSGFICHAYEAMGLVYMKGQRIMREKILAQIAAKKQRLRGRWPADETKKELAKALDELYQEIVATPLPVALPKKPRKKRAVAHK
jgi:hypothetical protein